jgi:hypothetical protein
MEVAVLVSMAVLSVFALGSLPTVIAHTEEARTQAPVSSSQGVRIPLYAYGFIGCKGGCEDCCKHTCKHQSAAACLSSKDSSAASEASKLAIDECVAFCNKRVQVRARRILAHSCLHVQTRMQMHVVLRKRHIPLHPHTK